MPILDNKLSSLGIKPSKLVSGQIIILYLFPKLCSFSNDNFISFWIWSFLFFIFHLSFCFMLGWTRTIVLFSLITNGYLLKNLIKEQINKIKIGIKSNKKTNFLLGICKNKIIGKILNVKITKLPEKLPT